MRETLLATEKIFYQIIFIPLLIGTLITIGFSIYVWIDLYNNVKIVDYSTTNTYTLTSNSKQLTILGRTYNLENDVNNVKVDETIFALALMIDGIYNLITILKSNIKAAFLIQSMAKHTNPVILLQM